MKIRTLIVFLLSICILEQSTPAQQLLGKNFLEVYMPKKDIRNIEWGKGILIFTKSTKNISCPTLDFILQATPSNGKNIAFVKCRETIKINIIYWMLDTKYKIEDIGSNVSNTEQGKELLKWTIDELIDQPGFRQLNNLLDLRKESITRLDCLPCKENTTRCECSHL